MNYATRILLYAVVRQINPICIVYFIGLYICVSKRGDPVEEIVHKVKLSSNNEYVIQQLKSIISIGIRNSCLSQNIGSILMRLINNQSNQCVVTGIYSTASSIAGISLENIIFENCIFEKIDISKKMIKNIIFKNCDIFELLCDTDSLNDKISISFDEKSIPRTLLFLQKSNDITYIYSPTEIKNIVSNLSSEHKTGNLNIIEEPIQYLSNRYSLMLIIAIVVAWRNIPFCSIVLLSSMRAIPDVLYDAASIDGANKFQMFTRVTLPLLVPALGIIITFTSISAINVFDEVITISGYSNLGKTILLEDYMTTF